MSFFPLQQHTRTAQRRLDKSGNLLNLGLDESASKPAAVDSSWSRRETRVCVCWCTQAVVRILGFSFSAEDPENPCRKTWKLSKIMEMRRELRALLSCCERSRFTEPPSLRGCPRGCPRTRSSVSNLPPTALGSRKSTNHLPHAAQLLETTQ